VVLFTSPPDGPEGAGDASLFFFFLTRSREYTSVLSWYGCPSWLLLFFFLTPGCLLFPSPGLEEVDPFFPHARLEAIRYPLSPEAGEDKGRFLSFLRNADLPLLLSRRPFFFFSPGLGREETPPFFWARSPVAMLRDSFPLFSFFRGRLAPLSF